MNENSFRFLSAMSEIEERFIAEASGYPPAAFRHSPKRILRFLLAAALILSLCLLGLAAAGVVKLPAIDAWFLRRAAGYEEDSLTPLSGDNSRVLDDNDTLTIEALDTLYSGSSLRAAFLVTLKTLDDAYDSPVPSPLAGWRFEDSALLGAGGRLVKGEIRFLYKKDSDYLEANQFLLILSFDSLPSEAGPFRIELKNIACYDPGSGWERLYEGSWTYVLNEVHPGSGGKRIYPDTPCTIDGFAFRIQEVDLSAFSCVIRCQLDEEQLSSWYAELPENSSRFHAAAGDLKLLSKDGRSIPYVLSTGTVSADETHWTGGYQIHAVYDTPVLPEDVQQLQVFGQVISLP